MRKQRRRRESLGEYSKEKKQEGKELLEKRKVQQFVTRMTWRQRKNEQERLKGQEMKEGMKDGRRSIIQAKVTTVPVFSWVCRHCPVSFPFLWLFCEKEETLYALPLTSLFCSTRSATSIRCSCSCFTSSSCLFIACSGKAVWTRDYHFFSITTVVSKFGWRTQEQEKKQLLTKSANSRRNERVFLMMRFRRRKVSLNMTRMKKQTTQVRRLFKDGRRRRRRRSTILVFNWNSLFCRFVCVFFFFFFFLVVFLYVLLFNYAEIKEELKKKLKCIQTTHRTSQAGNISQVFLFHSVATSSYCISEDFPEDFQHHRRPFSFSDETVCSATTFPSSIDDDDRRDDHAFKFAVQMHLLSNNSASHSIR